jgi:hypothetical protein
MSELGLPLVEFSLEVGRQPDIRRDAERMRQQLSRHCLNMVRNGLIPSRRINGRWFVQPEYARQAAEILGLIPKPAQLAEEEH